MNGGGAGTTMWLRGRLYVMPIAAIIKAVFISLSNDRKTHATADMVETEHLYTAGICLFWHNTLD